MNSSATESLITVLYEQAEVEIKNNDYKRALSTLEKLMDLIKDCPEHYAYGGAKRLYAMIYKYQGKFQLALNSAKEALSFFTKRNDYMEIYRIRELMGNIFHHFCRYSEAVKEWELALEAISFFNDGMAQLRSKAKIHIKLGEVLILLSRYKEARSNYAKGLSYSQQLKDPALMGKCKMGIGVTYHRESRFKLALQLYYQAFKLIRKNNDQVLMGRLFHCLGDIFTKLGQFEKAKKKYEKSLEISEKTGDFLTSAATLREIGRLYLDFDPEKTAFFCERSLDKLIENITAETRWECERLMGKIFYLMALYHLQKNEKKEAMSNLIEAGEIFHKFDMKKEKKSAEILYQRITGQPVKTKSYSKSRVLSVKLGLI
ncbi:hypothetical protein BBF96_11740 [Anoxybacter fermentans]|uniref:Uncharacterized protein n=1 Tax=Anoxybacter fermentans TaxID=1323375 RepID=A0A3S9T0G9_9FIRM|nr:tetratricopeptide repeat protein [Anoxybacter fermentans]AZR74005.1 hypothetical protein BBF96_11740 [Anoxybacter fermentans]